MKQFLSFGLDMANQCLLHNGATIDLAPKPFAVLRYLVENAGRLVTYDELLDALWPETYVQPQVLRTYMLELRKVLGDDATRPKFIQTLPKRGYRFVAAVTEQAGTTQQAHVRPLANIPAQIVGRKAELSALQAQFQLAATGQRQMVMICGDPGIGKTALADAFSRELAAGIEITVARGQCVQGLGVSEEYYPVAEALSQLWAQPHGEAACRILRRHAPAWLAHGHEADAAPTHASSQDRGLGDLCAALEELSAETLLLFIFEDLQWADEGTLNLISALARRRAPARMMVVTTHCPHLGSNESLLKAMKQDLLIRRLAIEIALAPLTKSVVKDLCIRELKQESLPLGLVDFVYQRSEGNPLFVVAVVEHLIAERILARNQADGWEQCEPFPETEAGVPNQLAHMIELVIERLNDEERRLLEAASMMRVAFPAWAVAAALEMDAVETEEAVDALARRVHFVVRAGQDELPDGTVSSFYVFAHRIYREVLYSRQSSARRARRHIRIAERLGELFAGREGAVARERAMHYEAAGDHERAARLLESAVREQAGVC